MSSIYVKLYYSHIVKLHIEILMYIKPIITNKPNKPNISNNVIYL